MRLEYELSLQDFKAAFKLHNRQTFGRRFVPWIGPCLLCTSIIAFIVFSIRNDPKLAAQAIAISAGSLVITIGAPISRSLNCRRSFERLLPPERKNRISTIDLNDERIIRTISGVAELKLLWDGIYGFAQNERVTLIYTNKASFLIIPTRDMSPEQRGELDGLFTRHVARKHPC